MRMAGWSERDIPALTGRVAVITGANSGLGFHTALQLATHGASVVLACRNTDSGEGAAAQIRTGAPGATVQVMELDLASLAAVRQFVNRFNGAYPGLDLLVNNAGVMALPYRQTADGFEMQFGTNHLGHFALTGLLLSSLLARPGARVVTVSSMEGARGRMDFDDLQGERGYKPWGAYRQSKLANLLFMLELDRLLRKRGLDLISVGAHPGYAATNLQSAGPRMSGRRWTGLLLAIGNRLFAQSAKQGALPELYAATAPAVGGGDYYGPDRFRHTRGSPVKVPLPKQAMDAHSARRLWQVSEQLTGVHYEPLADAAAQPSP
jgi:NAD(P)-dependent dehydrogenase (short-subunit alcohol dehydrogenase family)